MEMSTLDLRRDKKTLGIEAEQQHSSMRRPTLVQQIEMGQQLKSGGIFLKGKPAKQPRPADKANHRLCIKVSKRSIRAYRRIKFSSHWRKTHQHAHYYYRKTTKIKGTSI